MVAKGSRRRAANVIAAAVVCVAGLHSSVSSYLLIAHPRQSVNFDWKLLAGEAACRAPALI
jgi:hypothetical protein